MYLAYLSLDSPECRAWEKIQIQVVSLGSDPKKQSIALGKRVKEKKKANEETSGKHVTIVGNWASLQWGTFWNSAFHIPELSYQEAIH